MSYGGFGRMTLISRVACTPSRSGIAISITTRSDGDRALPEWRQSIACFADYADIFVVSSNAAKTLAHNCGRLTI